MDAETDSYMDKQVEIKHSLLLRLIENSEAMSEAIRQDNPTLAAIIDEESREARLSLYAAYLLSI